MDTNTLMLINFKEMRSEVLKILFPRNESPGKVLVNREIFKDPKIQQLVSKSKTLNINQKHRFEVIPQSEQKKWQTSHSIAISYRSDPIDSATKKEVSIHRGLEKIIHTLNVLPIGIGIYIPENSLQIYGFDLPKGISKGFLNYVHSLLDPEYETFKNSVPLEFLMFYQKLFPDENSPGTILKDKEKIEGLCREHKKMMPSNGPFIGGEIVFQGNVPMLNVFATALNTISGIKENMAGNMMDFSGGLNYFMEDNKIPFEIILHDGRALLIFKHMYLCENMEVMNSIKEEFNLSSAAIS